jgi:hypothetical protein
MVACSFLAGGFVQDLGGICFHAYATARGQRGQHVPEMVRKVKAGGGGRIVVFSTLPSGFGGSSRGQGESPGNDFDAACVAHNKSKNNSNDLLRNNKIIHLEKKLDSFGVFNSLFSWTRKRSKLGSKPLDRIENGLLLK